MTEPLTDAEIAELRGYLGGDPEHREYWSKEIADAAQRLLEEVTRSRVASKVVGVCKHKSPHAPYCASCCASFDPTRMVLIHERRCQFRGHEKSATEPKPDGAASP